MNVLLRFLGFEAVAALGRRLPPRGARLFSLAMLLFANLIPVILVLVGSWRVGDVFAIYWIENLILWVITISKLLTVNGPDSSRLGRFGTAGFFTFHYGIFTLVHGAFTGAIIGFTGGLDSTPTEMLITALLIFGSHLFMLTMNWFGRGQRQTVSVQSTMWAPYPRMLVLHVSIIAGFILIMGAGDQPFAASGQGSLLAVLLLCGLKTVLELGLQWVWWLREESSVRTPVSTPASA